MKKLFDSGRVWPLFALISGALCLAARRWQLSTAFEGSLELPIPGAPATIVLVVLLVLSLAVSVVLSQRQLVSRSIRRGTLPIDYFRGSSLFTGAMTASAALAVMAAPSLISTGVLLWQEHQNDPLEVTNNGVLYILTGVTAVLAAVGLVLTALAALRETQKGRAAILFPAANGCLWLMELYRSQAANPVLWDYGPQLAAVACGVLFYLDWCGLHAGSGTARRSLWLASMTVILSAVALAGPWELSSALLLTSQMIAALAVLWCLPDNLKHPPEHEPEPAPAEEEKLEEETHE